MTKPALWRAAAVSVVVTTVAGAGPAPPPEYGLRGLQKVELVYKAPPGSNDLADDSECQAIGPVLRAAGIHLVQRCHHDDLECGKLIASTAIGPVEGGADRAYAVELALTQSLELRRNPSLVLSAPTTWSERRVGVVPADRSPTRASCIALRDLANEFSSLWKAANK